MSTAMPTHSRPPRIRVPKPPADSPPFLWPALETMVRLRRIRGSGVFLFVAPHTGAGTTHVVNLLADELTREFGQCVLVASSKDVKNHKVNEGPRGCVERGPDVWVPVADAEIDAMTSEQLANVGIGFSAESFDFILVDCPSLDNGRRGMRLGVAADGAFLVAEAGKTTLHEIENAQRLFKVSSVRLEGVILNRRTYAIPKSLYKIL